MSDKLQDAVKMLREYCGGIPLSNAIIYIVEHDRCVEELINKLREENDNCKAQYQHWDEKYSDCLIEIRELKEQNNKARELLKLTIDTKYSLHKSCYNCSHFTSDRICDIGKYFYGTGEKACEWEWKHMSEIIKFLHN